MNYLIGIDTSVHERMVQKYARYFKSRSAPAPLEREEDEPRLCVEGLAVVFDDPIGTKTGEILVIENGAFDAHLSKNCLTEVWLAHNPTEIVCSTTSGLELAQTKDGLAFRFPLDNKRYADTIQQMVASGKQAAVSVGITRTKERKEMVGRHKVTFVESAELRECSLVAAGACDQAFARLIDADHSPSLADSINSVPFKIDSGMHNIKTKREKNMSRIESLMQRLNALECRQTNFSAAPRGITPRTMWSIHDSNRSTTAQVEWLQEQARRRLA